MRQRTKRDVWELADDQPAPWHMTIHRRAEELQHTIDADVRWALFATQAVVEDIARFPEAVAIRHIALYGPLTNGVVGERIGVAVIMQDAVAALQASLWDKLNAALLQAEHTYALRFDCLLLTEREIADSQHPPNAWLTIAHEHVVMWP